MPEHIVEGKPKPHAKGYHEYGGNDQQVWDIRRDKKEIFRLQEGRFDSGLKVTLEK